MSPLDDPSAAAYLAALAARLDERLGAALVGIYLVNSGARDDYLPGRSDLDLAVIVDVASEQGVWLRIAEALRHRALPCPAPRLELVVYRREVVADPGPRPDWELNLNTGPAIVDHVGLDPATEPAHWFVLDLASAGDAARVVRGPAATSVFGAIEREHVLDALAASQAWHARHDTAAPNRVLNDCRAWRFVIEERWSSKTEAAAWALARGADPELVGLALDRRAGVRADDLPIERVQALAERVAGLIADARTPRP
jgi:Domain of unknown function (DUF4111)